MRVTTPRQIVEAEFNNLHKLITNLLIKDKNRSYYLRNGMKLNEHMSHVREQAEYILERLHQSKELCMDMAHED